MTTPKDAGKECSEDDCGGWAMDNGKCYHCGGKNYNGGAPEKNDNAQTHGLHTSAEVFFENADKRHLDTYYGIFQSLCRRFRDVHGRESLYHDKAELGEVAFEMAKLDMAKEYEKENAVDPGKPFTERQVKDIGGGMEVEAVSKVESLKLDIRRENRMTLKDKNIYASPESEAAGAMSDLAGVWPDELQQD